MLEFLGNNTTSALKNIRVISLTRIIYGPWLTTLLAIMGAEVIHIEMPASGDLLIRAVSPGAFPRGLSLGATAPNANKYHVAIDIRHPKGKRILQELVAVSDVFVENFKPGTLDSWGIGYVDMSKIKPDIIYISLSGFGNWGELCERPSYDAYAQGVTGLAEITGFPEAIPLKSQAWIGDFLSGTVGAFLVTSALYHRNKTGEGQFIDLAQSEVLIRVMDWTWLYIHLTGKDRERTGNRDYAVVPSLIAKAKDGFIAIGAFEKREYISLCDAMNSEELKEYVDFPARFKNADKIYEAIEKWVSDKRIEEIEELALKYGFMVGRVMNSKEIYEDPHYRSRGVVALFEDPIYGDMAMPNPLGNLQKTPARIKWTVRPVGIDNEHVLTRILGYHQDEIDELYREGVIGKWDPKFPGTSPPENWDGISGLFY